MPQPLPVGKSVTYGPNAILARPELAALVANVCSNWALIEGEMMKLYGLLMGTYLPQTPGAAPVIHPVALQVFDALNALGPRLDLLNRLCSWRATKEEATAMRESISPMIRKRFAERSAVAHAIWGTCEDYPDALILVRTFDGQQLYRKPDFAELSGRILELRAQLAAFVSPIYDRLRR